MNNKNSNQRGEKTKQRQAAATARKQLKNEILNEIRAAAGVPAKGKGRGKRNRQTKANQKSQLAGKGSTRNMAGSKRNMPVFESEYIAEIIPSAFPAFSLQSFPVNPGQAATFPWLSSIAKNFDKYEFDSLAFVYKREVSEFAANGVTGKVIMWFDPSPTDPAPTTKQQMEDSEPHCDCMPCENMRLVVPREILQRFNDARFVRPGQQPANTDLKTYDIGTLYVACQGTAANTAVGELHVEYQLRLREPVLLALGGTAGTLQGAGGGLAAATPFGNAAVQTGPYTLGAVGNLVSGTGFLIGSELSVTFDITGTGITLVGLNTGLVGVTIKTNMFAGFPAAATTGSASLTYTVTASNISFNAAVTATTVTASELIVSLLNPAPAF